MAAQRLMSGGRRRFTRRIFTLKNTAALPLPTLISSGVGGVVLGWGGRGVCYQLPLPANLLATARLDPMKELAALLQSQFLHFYSINVLLQKADAVIFFLTLLKSRTVLGRAEPMTSFKKRKKTLKKNNCRMEAVGFFALPL